ncbi:MAG: DNA-directed RNA polymerase subunit B'' [archaeon]
MNKQILVRKYLEEHSLVESNILSFNDFIDFGLQEIINQINEELNREEVDLWIGKIKVRKPQIIEADGSIREIMPIEAKLRKITYSAPIFLEVAVGNKEFSEVEMGRIPILIKSKHCHLHGMSKEDLIKNYEDPTDQGGYFVINGNPRAMALIEDLAQNQSFTEDTPKGQSLRLFSQRGSYRIPNTISETPDGIIYTSFSRFKNIPAILMVKALGITKDSEIAELIGKDSDIVIINLYEYADLANTQDALLRIATLMNIQGTQKEILDRVKLRLDSAFLPHIGTKQDFRKEKAANLCKLIKHFLISKELKLSSDKDHYANKRIRLSGDLLTDLFRVNLTIFIRDLQHSLQKIAKKKKFYSIKSIAKSTLFAHRIESALATGSWIGERKGVTNNLDQTNRFAVLSQLQRVSSLLAAEQENFKARTLHPTQFGRFCPIETPEGSPIGLRKNLALLARISTNERIDENELKKTLIESGMETIK